MRVDRISPCRAPWRWLKRARRAVDKIDMDADTKLTRPPIWVFGVLFLAYLGSHVALLLFVYTVAPSTPYLLAETLAIGGGAVAAGAGLVAWRRSIEPDGEWASGPERRA